MEEKIWHCIFCGTHGSREYFKLPSKFGPITACPYCKEYKGLELCNPNTCECWTIAVVRELAEGEINEVR